MHFVDVKRFLKVHWSCGPQETGFLWKRSRFGKVPSAPDSGAHFEESIRVNSKIKDGICFPSPCLGCNMVRHCKLSRTVRFAVRHRAVLWGEESNPRDNPSIVDDVR